MRLPKLALALALAVVAAAPAPPGPSTDGVGSPNMSHVANVQWDGSARGESRSIDSQGGTDVEFATIGGRDYAFAGTYENGLQVIDVTDPTAPVKVTTYPCRILQGDVQVFFREDLGDSGRWLLTYTADDGYTHKRTKCHEDAGVTGTPNGTFLIDVTNPAAPKAINFVSMTGGSHNQTVRPGGRYLYNSRSDSAGVLEVYDITNPYASSFTKTRLTIGGDDSHDLTFNREGTRAYSAALDHTVIIDTTEPMSPKVVADIEDPAITLHHQADPVTIGERDYLIINDELNGAGGNELCPGGGLHVYDITDEQDPRKVGAFFIPEATVNQGARTGLGGTITCTSHVFRLYEEQQLMTIAWFGAGVRVIDLSGLSEMLPASAGVLGTTLTPGMEEIGYYRFAADSDAWSAKAYRFDADGSAYIFADDQTRGFDVYRYDAAAAETEARGTWLSPAEAMQRTLELRASGFVPVTRPYCDLRGLTS